MWLGRVIGLNIRRCISVQDHNSHGLRFLEIPPDGLRTTPVIYCRELGGLIRVPGIPEPHGIGGHITGGIACIGGAVVVPPQVSRVEGIRIGRAHQTEVDTILGAA